MRIRIASREDLKFIEGAYEHARAFMQANGNATQWPNGYPGRIDAEEDIARGHCFLVSDDDDTVQGTAYGSNARRAGFYIGGSKLRRDSSGRAVFKL